MSDNSSGAAAPAAAPANTDAAPPATAATRAAALNKRYAELAAADKSGVEEISTSDAKDVAPRDLMSPVNTDVMPHTGDVTIAETWDGHTSTFVPHSRALKTAIASARLGCHSTFTCQWLGLHLAMAVGFPVTVHSDYKALVKARCVQLNRFRDSAIAQGKRSLFAMMIASLSAATRDQVCADGIDDEECPDKLWAAIKKHAQGPFAKDTGAALMTKFFSAAWDSSAVSVVDQVDLNFRKMTEMLQTSDALGDSGYTITIPAALVKMISIMPAGLRIHERTYNEHQTLVVLRDEMRRDAARLDSSAAAGLKSFAVRNAELDTLKAEIALLKRQNGRGREGRHQSTAALTHAQRMDPNYRPPAGTPWPFKYFCTKHGHSTTHDDSGCYALHPELRPNSD
jgi:hypothetical protein